LFAAPHTNHNLYQTVTITVDFAVIHGRVKWKKWLYLSNVTKGIQFWNSRG